MDERQRRDLWEAIDHYANERTPASRAGVEQVVETIAVDFARFMGTVTRAFAACEAKSPTPRSEDIVAANPMVPNANRDILPGIQFKVVAAEVSLPEMQPREVLTVSERLMRQVDAKILAEIEQTAIDAQPSAAPNGNGNGLAREVQPPYTAAVAIECVEMLREALLAEDVRIVRVLHAGGEGTVQGLLGDLMAREIDAEILDVINSEMAGVATQEDDDE